MRDICGDRNIRALQPREAAAIADCLLAKVIGRGRVMRDECEEVFRQGARACGIYPNKP